MQHCLAYLIFVVICISGLIPFANAIHTIIADSIELMGLLSSDTHTHTSNAKSLFSDFPQIYSKTFKASCGEVLLHHFSLFLNSLPKQCHCWEFDAKIPGLALPGAPAPKP